MPIFETGSYRVRSTAVASVKRAIVEFVHYLRSAEPGTQLYLAWQSAEDPTRFLHLFIFEDEAARARHGRSEAVARFESVYGPELDGGEVAFAQYEMVAGKIDGPRLAASPGTAQVMSPDGAASGELLRAFYAAVQARDLAKARSYLADDLTFVGLFETYRTASHYLSALEGLLGITVRLDVKQIIAQGGEAAVFFELQTKAPAEGTVLVAEWHRIRDGKIWHVESAFDARPYAAMFTGAK